MSEKYTFYKAQGYLHHIREDYSKAIKAYLSDDVIYKSQVYQYIENALDELQSSNSNINVMKSSIFECMEQLTLLSTESIAFIILKYFPKDQDLVIKGLKRQKNLLYKYLKSSMDVAFSEVISLLIFFTFKIHTW